MFGFYAHSIASMRSARRKSEVVCGGLVVDSQTGVTGQDLLEAVGAAEREVAATAAQEPVGQWDAVHVRPALERAAGTSQALLASSAEASAALQVCVCCSEGPERGWRWGGFLAYLRRCPGG